MTRETLVGYDDGHDLVEVRVRGVWTVYDIDNNRQPLSGDGKPVGIAKLVRMRRPVWRKIADDKVVDYRGFPEGVPRAYVERRVFGDLERWTRRMLGIPAVYVDGWYLFHDRDVDRVLRNREDWRPVSLSEWRRLNGR